MSHEVFLHEMFSQPDDLIPRLIYADWLEDHGGYEQADLLRNWCDRFEKTKHVTTLKGWQRDLLPLWREWWLRIGLAGAPTDRTAAEEAVREAYRCANLAEPTTIVWRSSLAHLVKQGDELKELLLHQNDHSVIDVLNLQIRDRLRDRAQRQMVDHVREEVRVKVRDQVRDPVWLSVKAEARNRLAKFFPEVREGEKSDLCLIFKLGACYGLHDADWLAFYSFFSLVCGLEGLEQLRGLLNCALHCGWWYPFKTVAVLTEKPTEVIMKDQRLLKIEYSDGFRIVHQ